MRDPEGCHNGDETDAFSRRAQYHGFYKWRAKARHSIKKAYWRRVRRVRKLMTRLEAGSE